VLNDKRKLDPELLRLKQRTARLNLGLILALHPGLLVFGLMFTVNIVLFCFNLVNEVRIEVNLLTDLLDIGRINMSFKNMANWWFSGHLGGWVDFVEPMPRTWFHIGRRIDDDNLFNIQSIVPSNFQELFFMNKQMLNNFYLYIMSERIDQVDNLYITKLDFESRDRSIG